MGNQILPADHRAEVTLDAIYTPIRDRIMVAKSEDELEQIIRESLPNNISGRLITYMHTGGFGLIANLGHTKSHTVQRLINMLRQESCQGVPEVNRPVTTERTTGVVQEHVITTVYYTREDLIRWVNENDPLHQYFHIQEEETFTIIVNGQQFVTQLSTDQFVGMCFALNSVLSRNRIVTIISSIANDQAVGVENVAKNYVRYTEVTNQKYHIKIHQADDSYVTVYFDNLEFLQGILSVIGWYQLPNNGKDIVWKELSCQTDNGIVAMTL